MKKRILLLAASIAAGALLMMGMSLAYYTDTEQAVNVVTTGNVNIEMTEAVPTPSENQVWTVTEKTDQDNKVIGLQYSNILPGATIEKNPVVTNIGANDAYLRMKISVEITGKDGVALSAEGIQFLTESGEVVLVWDNEKEVVDLTSNEILKKGDSRSSFQNVSFPKTWGNEYAGASITINIVAEAVQSDYVDANKAFDNAQIEEYSVN